jgi:hypothetical protein
VIALLSIVGLSIGLSHMPFLRLNSVVVKGNIGIDAHDVEALVQKNLSGSYAAVYAKSNKFLYPKDTIEADIRSTFPSIEHLSVEAEGHTLEVTLSERKPAYLWCTGKPETKTTDACYFIDATGYIFSTGPQVSGDAYFTFFGLLSDDNPIGKTFLNETDIKAMTTIKEQLAKNDVAVRSLYADEKGTRELMLVHGGKIIFKVDQNLTVLLSSLELLKHKTTLLNTDAEKKLEYIDLRFGNKVYYKYIGDNAVQTEE